jgi:hypothetical protein
VNVTDVMSQERKVLLCFDSICESQVEAQRGWGDSSQDSLPLERRLTEGSLGWWCTPVIAALGRLRRGLRVQGHPGPHKL